ncbi:hypothetical protein BRADI_3g10932v3 [Brachypodium distachyon]|uniref:Uncharacterized protein n=1 Tax=Brachypodium distachyon TaxID=15368 RepID=A0A2K2CWH9_BRADI|nr:hypothetical protein BRADI_3g10932v3 [Brachypodium distachyon]
MSTQTKFITQANITTIHHGARRSERRRRQEADSGR